MKPTKVRLLLTLAVLAGAIGWGAVSLIQGQSGRILPVPWLAASTMWILALALGIWTLLARPRLQRRPGTKSLPPIVAARTAALAMAASRTGSLVGGFYLGVALAALPAGIAGRCPDAGRPETASSAATQAVNPAAMAPSGGRFAEREDGGGDGTGMVDVALAGGTDRGVQETLLCTARRPAIARPAPATHLAGLAWPLGLVSVFRRAGCLD